MKNAAFASILAATAPEAAQAGTWMTADVGRAVDLSTLSGVGETVTFTEIVVLRRGGAGDYAIYERSLECKSHAGTTLRGAVYAISLGASSETVTTRLSVQPDPLALSDPDVERIACGPPPQADGAPKMSATNYVVMRRVIEGLRMPTK